MQLVEAGRVGLDTEVSHYLAVFSGQPGGAITIRQLLSHTSGLSTFQGNLSHEDDPPQKDALARRVEQQAEVTPAYQPGEQVGVFEPKLPDSWSPDRSRQRADLPVLHCDQDPEAGRHEAQLRL